MATLLGEGGVVGSAEKVLGHPMESRQSTPALCVRVFV